MAYALPRINLLHDEDFARPCKQSAFAQTWEDTDVPIAVRVSGIASGIDAALSVDRVKLEQTASRLSRLCRVAFQTTVSMLSFCLPR